MTKWQAVTIQGALVVVLGALLEAPWISLFSRVLIVVVGLPLAVSWVANLRKVNRRDAA